MISLARLNEVLARFKDLRIGLIGDLFLDRYLQIEPNLQEMSIETGLEAYQIRQIRNAPGALGTVINNLAALGVPTIVPVTLIGNDGHGFDLIDSVSRLAVDTAHITRSADRLTPTYTKPLKQDTSGAWHELNRLDVRTRSSMNDGDSATIVSSLNAIASRIDGLIVLDQINEPDWGVVNSSVREALARIATEQPGLPIFIDSRQHLHRFDFGTLKGNAAEVIQAARHAGAENCIDVSTALKKLTAITGRAAFGTAGPDGIYVCDAEQRVCQLAALDITGPIDIVGAGDSVTAAIMCGMLAGANEVEAACIGNLAAAITIQQLGTTGVATTDQIRTCHQSAANAG